MGWTSAWIAGSCGLLVACAPPLGSPPLAAESPHEPGAQGSAIYGTGGPDPRLDASVFDVNKPNEADARRVATERCGPSFELIDKRDVATTNAGGCHEDNSIAAPVVKSLETTKSANTPTKCSPSSESGGTVFRFRCVTR